MRTIINISVPAAVAKSLKTTVKERGFASTSEYVRHLLRDAEERRIAEGVAISRAEFKKGKFKVLKSLADLD